MNYFEFLKRMMIYCSYKKQLFEISVELEDLITDVSPRVWKANTTLIDVSLEDLESQIDASSFPSILIEINSVTDDLISEYNILKISPHLMRLDVTVEDFEQTIMPVISKLHELIFDMLLTDEYSTIQVSAYRIAMMSDYSNTTMSDLANNTMYEITKIWK